MRRLKILEMRSIGVHFYSSAQIYRTSLWRRTQSWLDNKEAQRTQSHKWLTLKLAPFSCLRSPTFCVGCSISGKVSIFPVVHNLSWPRYHDRRVCQRNGKWLRISCPSRRRRSDERWGQEFSCRLMRRLYRDFRARMWLNLYRWLWIRDTSLCPTDHRLFHSQMCALQSYSLHLLSFCSVSRFNSRNVLNHASLARKIYV